jgi:hypothetical protein
LTTLSNIIDNTTNGCGRTTRTGGAENKNRDRRQLNARGTGLRKDIYSDGIRFPFGTEMIAMANGVRSSDKEQFWRIYLEAQAACGRELRDYCRERAAIEGLKDLQITRADSK